MTTKIKTILFTLLAVFGSVSSSLFLLSGTALAKTAAEMNNRERVVSYGYYQATSKCLENSLQATMRPQISTSDALNPQSWFVGTQGPTEMTVGRVIDASDGVRECQNLITGALNLWGYGADYSRFLIDVGYTLTGGNYTLPSNVPTNLGPAMRTAIRNRVYAGNSPTLTAPMNYILSLESFTLGCGAQALGTYSSLTQTAGGAADINARLNSSDGKHYRVNLVDTTTNPTTFQDTVFSIAANGDTQVGLYEDNSNPADITATCRELAQRVTANAGAFRTYYDALTPEQQTDVGNGGSATPPPGEEGSSSCVIEGIGWIVCPVAAFIAKITDGAYSLVETLLVFRLADDPFNTTTPTYIIWSNIRDLANVAFIFAFFMIVLSHATSIGLNNYGIKKMLPRLIVAAILVNLSYYICVLGIDISNILGAGLDGIVSSVPLAGAAAEDATWEHVVSVIFAGTGAIAGVAVASVLSTGGFWALVAAAGPFVITALFAILTALIILVARQALLIILIVVAPLAFIAYILPNTEGLFTKWRKSFMTMLIFYPLVALVFSGSKVAAGILRVSQPDNMFLVIASLAVQAFPLFALPFILKFSSGVLGRLGAFVNNPNKGPFDKLKKRAQGYASYRKNVGQAAKVRPQAFKRDVRRGFRRSKDANGNYEMRDKNRWDNAYGATARRENVRNRIYSGAEQTLKEAQSEHASTALQDASLAIKAAAGDVNRVTQVQAYALAENKKIQADRINAHASIIKDSKIFLQDSTFFDEAGAKFDKKDDAYDHLFSGKQVTVMDSSGRQKNLSLGTDAYATEAFLDGIAKQGLTGDIRRLRTKTDDKLRTDPTNAVAKMQKEALNDVIQDNYQSMGAKAPDFYKGNSAFTKTSGQDVAAWKPDTGGAALELLGRDLALIADPTERAKVAADQADARKSMTIALESIKQSPQLSAAVNTEMFNNLAEALSVSVPSHLQTNTGQVSSVTASAPTMPSGNPIYTPSPQQYMAPYSRDDISGLGEGGIRMVVGSAGGIQQLTDGDIAKVINSSRNEPTLQAIQQEFKAERDRRRIVNGSQSLPPTPPTPPSTPPSSPPPSTP